MYDWNDEQHAMALFFHTCAETLAFMQSAIESVQ